MTDKLIDCPIFIAMNEDEDWIVTFEEDEAINELIENYGGNQVRVVKVLVKMRPPVMAETEVTVPDDVGTTSTITAEAVE